MRRNSLASSLALAVPIREPDDDIMLDVNLVHLNKISLRIYVYEKFTVAHKARRRLGTHFLFAARSRMTDLFAASLEFHSWKSRPEKDGGFEMDSRHTFDQYLYFGLRATKIILVHADWRNSGSLILRVRTTINRN